MSFSNSSNQTPTQEQNQEQQGVENAAWPRCKPFVKMKAETEALAQGGVGKPSQAKHVEAHGGDGGVGDEVIRSEIERPLEQCQDLQRHRRSPIPFSTAIIQENTERAERTDSIYDSLREQTDVNILLIIVVGPTETSNGGHESDVYYLKEAYLSSFNNFDPYIKALDKDKCTKAGIKKFIHEYVEELNNNNIKVGQAILGLSSHGNSRKGFQASDGQHLTLDEIVRPVSKIAHEVVVFYSACRGNEDRLELGMMPSSAVPNKPCTGGCGCCLPPDVLSNCSVIYSCQSGYVTRWQQDSGSFMLKALWAIFCIHGIEGDQINIKDLADSIQTEVNKLYKDYNKNVFKTECYTQITYSIPDKKCPPMLTYYNSSSNYKDP